MSEQAQGMRQDPDLVLPPQTFAFVLDSTKGKVSAYVGPYKNSLSNTDQLVVWDEALKRVTPVSRVDAAIQTFVTAEEGQYIVLTNPAAGDGSVHPPKGNSTESIELDFGRREVVSGPATFPLWPGQSAQVIEGHHLRYNQYLIVRVYDADQARANWGQAVVATAAGEDDAAAPLADDTQLTMGQLHIIKGTEVSFYMPPTGVEVVPDAETGEFVRDAVTLETLEYCLLLDESGDKRYERGPAVVFPTATEKFVTSKYDGARVFQAIELNENSGLYVKVITEYTEDGVTHPVGEEMFITGKEQAIYFPRAEHSIIHYGNQKKHHAIAIPAGEGRYVLDRLTGQVELVKGPKMFLPNPIHQVVVRRILDPHDVETLYPGNVEAMQVNLAYRAANQQSAGEHLASAEVSNSITAGADFAGTSSLNYVEDSMVTGGLYAGTRSALPDFSTSGVLPEDETTLRRARKGRASASSVPGKAMSRSTSYTPPRMITLDTKYEGAVTMAIWPGYAVLVTDRSGNRRVEIGPKVVQLEYDEMIMTMELSTGRPKSDRNKLKTGYLRVANNVVSDLVSVETKDLVKIDIEVSYRVNFEGDDPLKWFEVENYVQVLTDNCRSRLRNVAKRSSIREFYGNTIDIARDTLLGAASAEGRTGLFFPENGMRVFDVEVLNVTIDDDVVAELLQEAQSEALSGDIQLLIAEEKALRDAKLQEIKRESILEEAKTREVEAAQRMITLAQSEREAIAKVEADLAFETKRVEVQQVALSVDKAKAEQAAELAALNNQVFLDRLTAETTEYIRRQESLSPQLIEAMSVFGERVVTERIVSAIAPAALASGSSTVDLLNQAFKGSALESVFGALSDRPLAAARSTNGREVPATI